MSIKMNTTRNKADFIAYRKTRERKLGVCRGVPNVHRIHQITWRTFRCFDCATKPVRSNVC